MSDETIPPRKQGTTITSVLFGTTNLHMRFPIGLDSILLRAPLTRPLLLAVLSREVLLDASEITESSQRIVVDA